MGEIVATRQILQGTPGCFQINLAVGLPRGANLMERLLDIREAAALLRIKPQTLYLWVSQKRVPHHKIGRLVRFTESDLQSFIEGQHQLAVGQKDEHLQEG